MPGSEGVAADGTIRSGADRAHVPAAFEPVVAAAVGALAGRAGVGLHLYGSVATGRAVLGVSDVDLLTTGLPVDAATALGRRLSTRFAALCRDVEVVAIQAADLAKGDEGYGNRVFLRHYCVHLAGVDLAADLPAYPADGRAARGFNGDVGRHLASWRAELEHDGDPAAMARRVARKALLAVAGLVSVHDATWTTDRERAARQWGEIDPAWAAPGEQLLAWSRGDDLPGAAGLGDALREGGPLEEVVLAFARRPGLWAS